MLMLDMPLGQTTVPGWPLSGPQHVAGREEGSVKPGSIIELMISCIFARCESWVLVLNYPTIMGLSWGWLVDHWWMIGLFSYRWFGWSYWEVLSRFWGSIPSCVDRSFSKSMVNLPSESLFWFPLPFGLNFATLQLCAWCMLLSYTNSWGAPIVGPGLLLTYTIFSHHSFKCTDPTTRVRGCVIMDLWVHARVESNHGLFSHFLGDGYFLWYTV